jgi:hypothetical protein
MEKDERRKISHKKCYAEKPEMPRGREFVH